MERSRERASEERHRLPGATAWLTPARSASGIFRQTFGRRVPTRPEGWRTTSTADADNPWIEFDCTIPDVSESHVKVYDGATWLANPMKLRGASGWLQKPVKLWDGSQWITVSNG